MGNHSRARREDVEVEQLPSQALDDEVWDSPEFRQSVILGVVSVTLPALVMILLNEPAIATAWFVAGMLVIAVGSRRQIRGLWRSLRSGPRPE